MATLQWHASKEQKLNLDEREAVGKMHEAAGGVSVKSQQPYTRVERIQMMQVTRGASLPEMQVVLPDLH